MNAVILYRIDSNKRMQRFYRLDVQPDLFGHWCFMRDWGRIGSSGQTRAACPSLLRQKQKPHSTRSAKPKSGAAIQRHEATT
jgi:hypothetical protein